MIKTIDYYLSVDLVESALAISSHSGWRGDCNAFKDAIPSLLYQSEVREVSTQEILQTLGDPDRTRDVGKRQVFEYDWADWHGPTRYTSTTHFMTSENKLIGLDKDFSAPAT